MNNTELNLSEKYIYTNFFAELIWFDDSDTHENGGNTGNENVEGEKAVLYSTPESHHTEDEYAVKDRILFKIKWYWNKRSVMGNEVIQWEMKLQILSLLNILHLLVLLVIEIV